MLVMNAALVATRFALNEFQDLKDIGDMIDLIQKKLASQ
jgi:hypothetical protein